LPRGPGTLNTPNGTTTEYEEEIDQRQQFVNGIDGVSTANMNRGGLEPLTRCFLSVCSLKHSYRPAERSLLRRVQPWPVTLLQFQTPDCFQGSQPLQASGKYPRRGRISM
jgi:hypothetical protein